MITMVTLNKIKMFYPNKSLVIGVTSRTAMKSVTTTSDSEIARSDIVTFIRIGKFNQNRTASNEVIIGNSISDITCHRYNSMGLFGRA